MFNEEWKPIEDHSVLELQELIDALYEKYEDTSIGKEERKSIRALWKKLTTAYNDKVGESVYKSSI